MYDGKGDGKFLLNIEMGSVKNRYCFWYYRYFRGR